VIFHGGEVSNYHRERQRQLVLPFLFIFENLTTTVKSGQGFLPEVVILNFGPSAQPFMQ